MYCQCSLLVTYSVTVATPNATFSPCDWSAWAGTGLLLVEKCQCTIPVLTVGLVRYHTAPPPLASVKKNSVTWKYFDRNLSIKIVVTWEFWTTSQDSTWLLHHLHSCSRALILVDYCQNLVRISHLAADVSDLCMSRAVWEVLDVSFSLS